MLKIRINSCSLLVVLMICSLKKLILGRINLTRSGDGCWYKAFDLPYVFATRLQ